MIGVTDLPQSDTHEKRRYYHYLYRDQLKAAGAQQVVNFGLYDRGRFVYSIFFADPATST